MKRIFAALFLLFAVTACASSKPAPVITEINFKDQPPIKLAVSDFQVVEEYQSPMQAPNVEHLFHPNPMDAAKALFRDRFVATGGQFLAKITITSAKIIDKPLDTTKGWRGWFRNDQSDRYEGCMQVRMDIIRPDGYVEAWVTAKAAETRVVLEDASPAEREQVWKELTATLAQNLNKELEKQINTNFGPILMSKPGV